MTIGDTDAEPIELTEEKTVNVPVKMTAEAIQSVTGKFVLNLSLIHI